VAKAAIPARSSASTPGQVRRRIIAISVIVVVAAVLLALALIAWFAAITPARLRAQAEAATQAADWSAALKFWRAFNATSGASAESFKQEARACLTLGLAAQAERSLRLATTAKPADPEAWRLLLEILRVEDRALDAQTLGWHAYDSVPPTDRQALLKQLTLALLTDVPDDVARATLTRWIKADPNDIDARVALSARIAAQPRASDPERDTRLAELESIINTHPNHIAAREALVNALFDAGEPARAGALLNSWLESSRDARYWRLQGRYLLDHAKQPELAAQALQNALSALPQDWRSWYRLARALRASKHPNGSDLLAAQTVARIRETLDPITLVPRLDAAFDHLDQSTAVLDLAALCDRVGLSKLAAAWRAQVGANSTLIPNSATPGSAPRPHS
jgi:tetratricopeptide (TPR) repeat protein